MFQVEEVDPADHPPDRPVWEGQHVAELDRCRRVSKPEVLTVGARQSHVDAHLHRASVPAAPAERYDPIVSCRGRAGSPAFAA